MRLALEDVRERIGQSLRLRPHRAVVAVIQSEPGSQFSDLGADLLREGELDAAQVEHILVSPARSAESSLRRANRDREALLATKRLILVTMDGATSARRALAAAPDLLAAPDLWIVLQAEAQTCPMTTADLATVLRRRMREAHANLDFTGLLPRDVEHRQLPLDRLFLDLVALERTQASATDPGQGSRAILVLADPGAGKTTLLRWLALRYSGDFAPGEEDPLGCGSLVPLLVPLADYGAFRERERVASLVEFLPRWLSEQGIHADGTLERLLPNTLLLLDGLDELRESAARTAVLNEARGLARSSRLGAVVVTGRSFLVDTLRREIGSWESKGCRAPSKAQVRAYLQAFVTLRHREHAERAATELAATIARDPDLRDLVRSPLLLMFLALLHELEGRLPDRRVEIYARLGELLVERWVHARSLSGTRARRPSRGQAIRVLGPLAWWLIERGGGAVSEDDLLEELTRIERRREGNDEDAARRAEALLRLLKHDSALLRPLPGRRWAFVHSSVAEFFAGRDAVRDRGRFDQVLATPFRPEWREIVLFTAGVLGVEAGDMQRLDRLVASVLKGCRRSSGGRYGARHPSLIVGLLREDPELSREQRRRLLDRLFEFWFANSLWPASARKAQQEAVDFLTWAERSQLREESRDRLEGWLLSPAPQDRTWRRLLNAACSPEDVELVESFRADLGDAPVDQMLVGTLLFTLPRLLGSFDLDGPALLRALAATGDPRLAAFSRRRLEADR